MSDTETLRPLALSFWPSLRRALAGIVGLVGLPLFVLAATSALKLLSGGGVVTPSGWITVLLSDLANRHAHGRMISMLEGGYHFGALGRSVCAHIEMMLHD